MAAPNLISPNSVQGKTEIAVLSTTLTTIISNPASSGRTVKVNTIRCANVTGSAALVNVSHYRTADNYLIKNGSIEGSKTLIVTDKNEYVYLEEGDILKASSDIAGSIHLTVNYEVIE